MSKDINPNKDLNTSTCSICNLATFNSFIQNGRFAVNKDPCICNFCADDLFMTYQEILKKEYAPFLESINDKFSVVLKPTNNNTVSKDLSIKSISSLLTTIKRHIIGQNDAIDQIVSSIYHNIYCKESNTKQNIMLIGDSGTGKTSTIKLIAENLNLPCVIEDATKYSEVGYVGHDIEEIFYNLLESSNYDFELAQHGIVVIDEGDKKSGSGNFGRDVSGESVLQSLLKPIEGTILYINVDEYSGESYPFDTSNITFIFMGAFPGLSKIRDARLGKETLGFGNHNTKFEDSNPNYVSEDLEKYGVLKEFNGRFSKIIELRKLTSEDYFTILQKSFSSPYKKYRKFLKTLGVTLYTKKDTFEEIVKKAISLKTGARALSSVVDNMFSLIELELFKNPKKYTTCYISKETVSNNSNFTLK